MIRLKDLSLRWRLLGQLAFTVVLLTCVLGLSLSLIFEYRVGGPVYERLDLLADYRSDLTPGTLYTRTGYLILQELETESDPVRIARQLELFDEYEKQFHASAAEYIERFPEGPFRRGLETEVYPSGSRFLKVAREEYLPLVSKADQKATRSDLLVKRLIPLFAEHRKLVEKNIQLTIDTSKREEEEAFAETRFWSRIMSIVSILSLLFLASYKYIVARGIIRSTDMLNARVGELAGGASDLTARIPVDSHDELGQLAEKINAMIAKIQSIVSNVRESSLQVLATASQIAATSRAQEAFVANLGSSTTQVAAAVREISATGKELANTMDELNGRSDQASELATANRVGLSNMEKTMGQLVESTASISAKLATIREKADSINMVVTTITKVADQTNLLSINAAIEAEKAGEFGRGFLVVAREIRRLADQTAVATLDIESIVKLMQDAVAAGVMQMDKFSDEVRTSVTRVADLNTQTGQVITEVAALSDRFGLVNEGMRNQATGAEQINEAMGVMSESTRKTTAALEEFNRATEHLRESIETLNKEIALFKV
ncbi:MAG: methyl-accepting chemotaxis protein [Bacteroidales bacterium]|nr:methyl-accepting chemotaxis protein [Bacteroidales bacterium]